jgi:regulation of enolase protein 1 (concanavalin A-like superfamily)
VDSGTLLLVNSEPLGTDAWTATYYGFTAGSFQTRVVCVR